MRDVGTVRVNHSVYVATRKLVGIGFFSLLHVGPKDGTQAVKMDSRRFYSLRHPAAHRL